MGLSDPYLAFCFDETVLYIQSFISYDDKGKLKWIKQPHWIDEEKPQSNNELYSEMKEKLEIMKKERGVS
jgi:hypothetical protein